jgi:hypothetical protein
MMALYKWDGTAKQKKQVHDASFLANSVNQFLNTMGYSNSTHYSLLRHPDYARAYTRGTSDKIDKSIKSLSKIIEDDSDKSAGARLEAIKYSISNCERQYVSALVAHGISLKDGTIKERLDKVYEAYVDGLLSLEVTKQICTLLKSQSDLQTSEQNELIIERIKELEGLSENKI